jgi:tRNA threonylcarbamoyladenosine biosynthesis protein TsaB
LFVLILALDTCDLRGSVALLRDDAVLQTSSHDTTEDYSSWLLPSVSRILAAAGVVLSQVDVFAAAAGPGSFTGVRVGLATVKAWAEVYRRGVAAVSRLLALALESSGNAPYVAPFFDARRNQVFGALFRRQGCDLQRLEEEMVIGADQFLDWCTAKTPGERIDWISTDGKCLADIPAWASRISASETIEVASPVLAPRIGKIGYQLALQGQLVDALALDANYVRRSDAELFWKGGSAHGD